MTDHTSHKSHSTDHANSSHSTHSPHHSSQDKKKQRHLTKAEMIVLGGFALLIGGFIVMNVFINKEGRTVENQAFEIEVRDESYSSQTAQCYTDSRTVIQWPDNAGRIVESMTAPGVFWNYFIDGPEPSPWPSGTLPNDTARASIQSLDRYRDGPCNSEHRGDSPCVFDSRTLYHPYLNPNGGILYESITAYGRLWTWEVNINSPGGAEYTLLEDENLTNILKYIYDEATPFQSIASEKDRSIQTAALSSNGYASPQNDGVPDEVKFGPCYQEREAIKNGEDAQCTFDTRTIFEHSYFIEDENGNNIPQTSRIESITKDGTRWTYDITNDINSPLLSYLSEDATPGMHNSYLSLFDSGDLKDIPAYNTHNFAMPCSGLDDSEACMFNSRTVVMMGNTLVDSIFAINEDGNRAFWNYLYEYIYDDAGNLVNIGFDYERSTLSDVLTSIDRYNNGICSYQQAEPTHTPIPRTPLPTSPTPTRVPTAMQITAGRGSATPVPTWTLTPTPRVPTAMDLSQGPGEGTPVPTWTLTPTPGSVTVTSEPPSNRCLNEPQDCIVTGGVDECTAMCGSNFRCQGYDPITGALGTCVQR